MSTKKIQEAVKAPITFKEFSKDPVKGLLFIVLIAIGYLYVDGKMTNKDIIVKQESKIIKLEAKVDTLTRELQRVTNESAVINTRMSVLEQLGKISK